MDTYMLSLSKTNGNPSSVPKQGVQTKGFKSSGKIRCWARKKNAEKNIISVLVCSSYYDKIPERVQLQQQKFIFSTVLESGKSRSSCLQIQFLVRALFLVSRRPSSGCILIWLQREGRGERERSCVSSCKNTILIELGSHPYGLI